MISRLAGAIVRAVLVVLLIATPSLLLPGVTSDVTQVVALISIFAAALTIFEYASVYPGIVEFRNAPPFNRLRFLALFLIVFMISVVIRGETSPSALTDMITDLGTGIGAAIDFPYSPVRQIVLLLPDDANLTHVDRVRTAAGISYFFSMLTLAIFYFCVRVKNWPLHRGPFNVWVNLPTFDPTTGGDVVQRLERDARFNIVVGFTMPFFIPAALKASENLFGQVTLENPQSMVWIVAAWAFLPSSLLMRGLAMGRIAALIERKRAIAGRDEMQPA
ncbi:MAG: hypothetical protein CMH12_14635 [Maritimibacter sp.]|nr:hypothetical protein [Psychromarinibacter halotolerans]MAQ84460.1 hypothetical protein [Maritimibacter sp.]MDF0596528.1 hypothetical protein [Psychromarinibacter halotolerans]